MIMDVHLAIPLLPFGPRVWRNRFSYIFVGLIAFSGNSFHVWILPKGAGSVLFWPKCFYLVTQCPRKVGAYSDGRCIVSSWLVNGIVEFWCQQRSSV